MSVLNGPAAFDSVDISTAEELKVGANRLDGRRVVSIQPLDGDIHLGFDNTVSATKRAMTIRKGQFIEREASDQLAIWIIADTGTVKVNIAEIG